jgi:hypothetical protein
VQALTLLITITKPKKNFPVVNTLAYSKVEKFDNLAASNTATLKYRAYKFPTSGVNVIKLFSFVADDKAK